MSRVLALDIGEKRIGVAISDPMGVIAQPFITIEWKGIKTLSKTLSEIIKEKDVSEVIIGIPFTLKGKISKKTEEVLKIKSKLEKKLGITLIAEDERLTTQMANKALYQMGRKPSKSKDKIDQIAAFYILQSYLHRKN